MSSNRMNNEMLEALRIYLEATAKNKSNTIEMYNNILNGEGSASDKVAKLIAEAQKSQSSAGILAAITKVNNPTNQLHQFIKKFETDPEGAIAGINSLAENEKSAKKVFPEKQAAYKTDTQFRDDDAPKPLPAPPPLADPPRLQPPPDLSNMDAIRDHILILVKNNAYDKIFMNNYKMSEERKETFIKAIAIRSALITLAQNVVNGMIKVNHDDVKDPTTDIYYTLMATQDELTHKVNSIKAHVNPDGEAAKLLAKSLAESKNSGLTQTLILPTVAKAAPPLQSVPAKHVDNVSTQKTMMHKRKKHSSTHSRRALSSLSRGYQDPHHASEMFNRKPLATKPSIPATKTRPARKTNDAIFSETVKRWRSRR